MYIPIISTTTKDNDMFTINSTSREEIEIARTGWEVIPLSVVEVQGLEGGSGISFASDDVHQAAILGDTMLGRLELEPSVIPGAGFGVHRPNVGRVIALARISQQPKKEIKVNQSYKEHKITKTGWSTHSSYINSTKKVHVVLMKGHSEIHTALSGCMCSILSLEPGVNVPGNVRRREFSL